MKIKVPFHYPVSFLPYRKILPLTAYFASEMEIEIPEVERADVRTVIRVGTLPGDRAGEPKPWTTRDPYCAKPDGSMREIILHDGALWVESLPIDEIVQSLTEDGGHAGPFHDQYGVLDLRATKKKDAHGQTPNVWKSRAHLESKHPTPFRSFEDDGGKRLKELIERRARSTRLLDGKVYVRCAEPQLCIEERFGKAAVKFDRSAFAYSREGVDVINHGGYHWDESKANLYNLNEAETGLQELRQTHSDKEIQKIAVFEVIDPTIISATPHAAGVIRRATEALTQLWSYPRAMLPDVVERAVELRDALAVAHGQVTPRLLSAIEDIAALPEPAPQQIERWKRLAAARPIRPDDDDRKKKEPSRAAEIVAHIDHRTRAVEHARSALRRFAIRPAEMSWEDRALQINAAQFNNVTSVELLSRGALSAVCHGLGIDPAPLLQDVAAGDRVFATFDSSGLHSLSSLRALMALDPHAQVVRHIGGKAEDVAVVDRHLEEALAHELGHDQQNELSTVMAP